jgi:hypothetical protein
MGLKNSGKFNKDHFTTGGTSPELPEIAERARQKVGQERRKAHDQAPDAGDRHGGGPAPGIHIRGEEVIARAVDQAADEERRLARARARRQEAARRRDEERDQIAAAARKAEAEAVLSSRPVPPPAPERQSTPGPQVPVDKDSVPSAPVNKVVWPLTFAAAAFSAPVNALRRALDAWSHLRKRIDESIARVEDRGRGVWRDWTGRHYGSKR